VRKKDWIAKFSLPAVIIIAGLVILLYLHYKRRGISEIASTLAKRGELLISVTEVGMLEALKSVSIVSPTHGKIIKLVPEGSLAEEGDPVAWFDATELEKQVKDREADLGKAEANHQKAKENAQLKEFQDEMSVKSAQSQLKLARVKLQSAKENLERKKRLFKAELISESALETAKLTLLRAELELENAEIGLAKAQETQKSNQITRHIGLKNSEASLGEQEELEKTVVKAPASGIVIYSKIWKGAGIDKIQEGDQVWRGSSIMELPDLSKMMNVVKINEVDISKIKVEQEVRVKVEALPEVELQGKVTKIATLAVDKAEQRLPWESKKETYGMKVFEVRAEIEGHHPDLKPGMTTKTTIVVEKLKDVVRIPLEAVFEVKGQKVVYILGSLVPERREVVLGTSDGNYVVIKDGLQEGERVSLRDPMRRLKAIGVPKERKEEEGPKVPVLPQSERRK
jgi:multidrug resistance efflux pump